MIIVYQLDFFLFLIQIDADTRSWSEPETSGTEPVAHSSTAGVIGKRIYVYGGLVDGQAVDDIYCLDTGQLNLSPLIIPYQTSHNSNPI